MSVQNTTNQHCEKKRLVHHKSHYLKGFMLYVKLYNEICICRKTSSMHTKAFTHVQISIPLNKQTKIVEIFFFCMQLTNCTLLLLLVFITSCKNHTAAHAIAAANVERNTFTHISRNLQMKCTLLQVNLEANL